MCGGGGGAGGGVQGVRTHPQILRVVLFFLQMYLGFFS